MREEQQDAMPKEEVLDKLRFELAFIELGGYERSVREPRKELSVFQESPVCPNYADSERTVPCEECFLMSFVPTEQRNETVPCHHIPLNARGDTVASMEGSGDDFRVHDAFHTWLRGTIRELEAKRIAQAEAIGDV